MLTKNHWRLKSVHVLVTELTIPRRIKGTRLKGSVSHLTLRSFSPLNFLPPQQILDATVLNAGTLRCPERAPLLEKSLPALCLTLCPTPSHRWPCNQHWTNQHSRPDREGSGILGGGSGSGGPGAVGGQRQRPSPPLPACLSLSPAASEAQPHPGYMSWACVPRNSPSPDPPAGRALCREEGPRQPWRRRLGTGSRGWKAHGHTSSFWLVRRRWLVVRRIRIPPAFLARQHAHLTGSDDQARGGGRTCLRSHGWGAGRQSPREASGRLQLLLLLRVKVEKPKAPWAPRGSKGSHTINY